MLTTADLRLVNSESKAYLHVILYKEGKQATGLCISGWKMLKKTFIAVYGNHLHTYVSKKENRLLSFDLSSNALSIFTADYPHSSASIRQNHKNASSIGEEMVGLVPFYLCCNKYTGLWLSHVFIQIKNIIAKCAHNPKTLLTTDHKHLLHH